VIRTVPEAFRGADPYGRDAADQEAGILANELCGTLELQPDRIGRKGADVAELDLLQELGADLRIEGYIGASRSSSVTGRARSRPTIRARADDSQLTGGRRGLPRSCCGSPMSFGNVRPFAADAIRLQLEGPAELIGEKSLPPGRGVAGRMDPLPRKALERSGSQRLIPAGRAEHTDRDRTGTRPKRYDRAERPRSLNVAAVNAGREAGGWIAGAQTRCFYLWMTYRPPRTVWKRSV